MKALLTFRPTSRAAYYGPRALAALRDLAEVHLHESEVPLDPDALVAAARNMDLIVSERLTEAPASVFDRLPDLRAFLRCAVDIRNVDVPAASRAGILVTRAGPGFVASVTELALGFMVDLSRGISRATGEYKAGLDPRIVMGRQLSGGTAGIVGYGAIGRALAPVLATLGMNVLVSDPHATVDDPRVRHVPFETLLAESDYVVCLAVANAETENLMDEAAFARMKRDAVFLNLSRGNLVDEAALAAALREGRIAGAALDVGRAPDQMPTPALAALPNVVATPHVGGLTPPAIESQAFDTVRQVEAIVAGRVPDGAVNPETWTRRP